MYHVGVLEEDEDTLYNINIEDKEKVECHICSSFDKFQLTIIL
jgi:hypothetical protein